MSLLHAADCPRPPGHFRHRFTALCGPYRPSRYRCTVLWRFLLRRACLSSSPLWYSLGMRSPAHYARRLPATPLLSDRRTIPQVSAAVYSNRPRARGLPTMSCRAATMLYATSCRRKYVSMYPHLVPGQLAGPPGLRISISALPPPHTFSRVHHVDRCLRGRTTGIITPNAEPPWAVRAGLWIAFLVWPRPKRLLGRRLLQDLMQPIRSAPVNGLCLLRE
ncbi:hypothetical protein OH77DRAFT_208799 [Trametes cingulata]|nr:hypothetical protein OH77DRAFT_208799 [Trametes cingulata]